ncbi:MAG: hypothetical protein ACUVQZ_02175 [Candidatus Caldatribacteriaceae bacterium]
METRERVLKAVKEIEYIPNTLARSFVLQKTKTIGLLVTDIRNPFFMTVARRVENVAVKTILV